MRVTVVGAGVLGLWQALTCVRAGYRVRLVDRSAGGSQVNASAMAGGMLAPDCEAVTAPDVVRDLGRIGVRAWREVFPGVIGNGSLVVACARDRVELAHFSKMTCRFERVDGARLCVLEPDLGGRFSSGLLFADEAHVVVPDALEFLRSKVRGLGVEFRMGETYCAVDAVEDSRTGIVIDCRGLAAREDPFPGTEEVLSKLRGVRGERIVISTTDVRLSRPVRLLHPRHPIYVVPWDKDRFVVGATLVESEDRSGASVRSMLELLGSAFALHAGFGEAEVVDIEAGVRPAYPDNVPRVVISRGGRLISVNGAYRHGFLLAPVLGEAVCDFLRSGCVDHPMVVSEVDVQADGCGAG